MTLTNSGSKYIHDLQQPKIHFNPINYRYARAYMGIQFFDSDSLLPPPFTFLSIIVYAVQKCDRQRRERSQRNNSAIEGEQKHNLEINGTVTALADQTYPQLIFQLIDNAKPQPDHPKHSKKNGEKPA